jgi:alpha-ribazole phosphatase
MKTSLWVARHAPVRDPSVCYGRTDVDVSIGPDLAAACLLETYRGARPSYLWSSPASRCRLVAKRLADAWRIPLCVVPTLTELHFGKWEGQAWREIATGQAESYQRWLRDWQNVPPPQGELPADIESRVRGWLATLEPGATHMLVTHAGIIRALYVALEHCTWPDAMGRPVEHLAWASFTSFAGW